MISKLSVKRQWFQTAAAKRMFPALVGATGAVLEDVDSGSTVRVRVAGRSVSIEPTRAAASGRFRAADVDDKFRTKTRRVSISHDLLSADAFDPRRVPAECVLGGEERSYDSSCVVHLESDAEPAPNARAVHKANAEANANARAKAEAEAKAEANAEAKANAKAEAEAEAEAEAVRRERLAEADERLLETVKQIFDKTLCVSRHVPVIRLPLASVTFQYLCESSPPRAVLERLGERYLATLQSALRQSDGARGLYAAKCVGAGTELRQQILDGTWE